MNSELPIMGVAACGTCKAELQLVCPNGHDPEPIEVEGKPVRTRRKAASAQRTERPAQRIDPNVQRSPSKSPVFGDRTCACGTVFTPTGPNAKRCPRCRGFEG